MKLNRAWKPQRSGGC